MQYIWQHKLHNFTSLDTTDNQPLQILYPGFLNTNQGPDFLNAKIIVGNTTWAGSIELHLKTSDWDLHKHSTDKNYSNVILHVVWQNDLPIDKAFPTLELQHRVSNHLLSRYQELMQSPLFIPCQRHLPGVSELVVNIWKERMLVERLQQRAQVITATLIRNNYNWEETFWWLIARNFGIKVNSDAFEKIAQSISLNILGKHKNQIHQLEALLLGQAGLLDKTFAEDYPNMLRKEYSFLAKKYGLEKVHYPLYFLRMRPANFPTVRLAQLAMLIQKSHHLFSLLLEAKEAGDVLDLLEVTANDYWHYHYLLDEQTSFSKKNLGMQMKENIIINTCAPILYAYGFHNNNEAIQTKALEWERSLQPEKNKITKGFENLGVSNKNAADSQGLIHLKNNYCNYKLCLQCAIGNHILKP